MHDTLEGVYHDWNTCRKTFKLCSRITSWTYFDFTLKIFYNISCWDQWLNLVMLETLSCWYRQAKFELLLIEGIIIQIWFKLKKNGWFLGFIISNFVKRWIRYLASTGTNIRVLIIKQQLRWYILILIFYCFFKLVPRTRNY
jgi:hypothetical protein